MQRVELEEQSNASATAVVTTAQKASQEEQEKAYLASLLLGIPYVVRRRYSLRKIKEAHNNADILIMSQDGPILYTGEKVSHKFHLSMAQLRLIAYDRGDVEHLLAAVGEEPVESFLDCTVGLCSDSLMVSYGHPEIHRFIGLEGNPLLAYISNYGCRHFVHESQAVTNALRRIQLCAMRYEIFLKQAKSKSFDIVYFDPMFEVPVKESPQFLALRGHIVESSLTQEMLEEAKRVARRKVIVKERPFATIFKMWPPSYLQGGQYSKVAYGVYEV